MEELTLLLDDITVIKGSVAVAVNLRQHLLFKEVLDTLRCIEEIFLNLFTTRFLAVHSPKVNETVLLGKVDDSRTSSRSGNKKFIGLRQELNILDFDNIAFLDILGNAVVETIMTVKITVVIRCGITLVAITLASVRSLYLLVDLETDSVPTILIQIPIKILDWLYIGIFFTNCCH